MSKQQYTKYINFVKKLKCSDPLNFGNINELGEITFTHIIRTMDRIKQHQTLLNSKLNSYD